MALPSLTKTWQFNVNNAQTAQGTALADNRLALFNIKTAMIGFGTQPWTVVSSSDSTASGNTDKWVAATNLVWNTAGSAHSWIVLKQTGIGSNAQLLISCSASSGSGLNATIKFSPSVGFTGGTTTADPTATDAITFINGVAWTTINTDVALRWSVMQSTDGQCTRVFVFSGGTLTSFWMIEKFANATGGTPGASNTGWGFATTLLSVVNTFNGQTNQNGTTAATIISYESASNIAIASEVSGAWDMFPIGIVCTATAGCRGKLGTIQDAWFGSSGIALGDTYPATGSPLAQFVQFGLLILPWNNGAVNLT